MVNAFGYRRQKEYRFTLIFKNNHQLGLTNYMRLLTNDGLDIFWFICDIEELPSTKSVVQRFLKGSQMIEDLRGHQGRKSSAPKCLIFIQNLTKK